MSFRIDATFEDTRIVAVGEPEAMVVCVIDIPTGKDKDTTMTLEEVGKLVAYCASGLDGDDLCITYEECHAIQETAGFPLMMSLIP